MASAVLLKVFMLQVVAVTLFKSAACLFREDPADTVCTLGQSFIVRSRVPEYAYTAYWMFNGEPIYINRPPPAGVIPTSFNELFELSITCIPERHYITVQCIAVVPESRFPGGEEKSPPALIRVQGLPDQVVAINVTSTHSSITLTWEPPAPNLTYCVAVHALNISRDGHSRATEGAEYCMLNQTLFVFSSADSGHDFEFIVTAVSMLGRGPPSAHITANLSAVYFSPDLAVISSTASIDVSSTVSTVIMITPTPNLIQSMKNSPSSLFSVAAILILLFLVLFIISVICSYLFIKKRKKKVIKVDLMKCVAYESAGPPPCVVEKKKIDESLKSPKKEPIYASIANS